MLDDGGTVTVEDEDLWPIYELLWELAKEPGAISTAALLMDAGRMNPFARRPVTLTKPQSAVLRQVVARMATARHFPNPS